jgi:hypothetical protein
MNMLNILKVSCAALVVLLGLVVIYFFKPGISPIYPPCPFHYITGLYCPGCGSLRATHALLHGEILAALDLNPLMVVSIPFLTYGFISLALYRIRGRGLPRLIKHPFWVWAILALIIVYTVLRNLPYYPFSVLAP